MFTDVLSSHADLVAQRVLLATREILSWRVY
jgi:hypothetical protein